MDLVLQKVIDHGWQSGKKGTCKDATPFQSLLVVTCAGIDDTELPRQSANQVGDHGDIMSKVIISRSDIDPSTTRDSANNANK